MIGETQQLQDIAKRLDRRINQAASKGTRFTFLMLALLLIVMSIVGFWGNRYLSTIDKQLVDLEKSVKAVTLATSRNPQSSLVRNEEVTSLNARLNSLENLQGAMASTSKSALEQMNYIFTIIASFFGLFALYFAYRQTKADSTHEEHDEEMRGLVASFQQNITTISSLISTLEQSFAYRKEIQEELDTLRKRAKVLETHTEESNTAVLNLISELNLEAVKLFLADMDRANLSLEENRRKLEAFANKLTSVERTRDVEDLLNPFCYYVRGLSNVGVYQYELATDDFEIAYRKGQGEMAGPKLTTYAKHDRENITSMVDKMLISSSYFQGVSYKNLGEYEKSGNKFQEALDRDANHLQSKTYLLQVMYFDIARIPFETIENEYKKTIQDFEKLRKDPDFDKDKLKKAFNTLKINQGSMYLKKAFYLDFNESYKKFENSNQAINYFWEAHKEIQNDLAIFALAQGMENVGSSAWRGHTDEEFYKKVMSQIKRRVAEDPDRLY